MSSPFKSLLMNLTWFKVKFTFIWNIALRDPEQLLIVKSLMVISLVMVLSSSRDSISSIGVVKKLNLLFPSIVLLFPFMTSFFMLSLMLIAPVASVIWYVFPFRLTVKSLSVLVVNVL